MDTKIMAPILFPYDPEEFWDKIRGIIKEELNNKEKLKQVDELYNTAGLTYKPLYKIVEVCSIFNVTRPTIYDWIKHGKLKPYKVRSRLYFLHNDIQTMLGAGAA